jgi:ectoine hydroxylase-related dioxygenase (phytanoyl-CoA dioxygenase family)
MENVYVIQGAITSRELLKFSEECNYYRSAIGNSDLSELGSAIDIFEEFNLSESHGARRDPDSYFAERWRKKNTIDEDKAIVKSFLLVKLPSIISKVFACHKLHIFNEVYIVKEPHSQVAFRWHTDSEEQLCALPMSHRSSYYSAWCPLDRATVDNGTLAFPLGTNIVELQFDDKTKTDGNFLVAKSHTEDADDEVKRVLISDTLQSPCPQPSDIDNGLLLTVDPGTIVLFSSTMWHRSGDNRSLLPRRVLYVQYSPTVITSSSSSCRKDSSSLHVDTVMGQNDEDFPLSFGVPCYLENSTVILHSEKTNTSGTFPSNLSGDAIQLLLQSNPKSVTDYSCKRTRFF